MSTSAAISFNGAQGVLGYMGAGVLSGATLTSPTLNLDVDGIYEFEGSVKMGATADLRFVFNSDTTAGNYDRSTNGGASANNALIAVSGSSGVSGSTFRFSGKIYKDIDGHPTAEILLASLSTTSLIGSTFMLVWRTTGTNVTSFQLNQSTGSLTSGNMQVFRKSAGIALSGFGYAEGAAFPTVGLVNGQKFYHTGANHLCFYSSALVVWLTEQQFVVPGTNQNNFIPVTSTINANIFRWDNSQDFSMYVERLVASTIVQTTSNSTNKYTATLIKSDTAQAATTLASFNTGLDTANAISPHDQTVGAIVNPVTHPSFGMTVVGSGSPGPLYVHPSIVYRLVIP